MSKFSKFLDNVQKSPYCKYNPLAWVAYGVGAVAGAVLFAPMAAIMTVGTV